MGLGAEGSVRGGFKALRAKGFKSSAVYRFNITVGGLGVSKP